MYVILESDDTLRLMAEVNQRMSEGWKPLGGVACYYDYPDKSVRYVQAIVRERASRAEPAAAPGQRDA